tara:strand:- start:3583 stop:3993 length:411 start_codon:yes stop_codon:yes gene_type:complete
MHNWADILKVKQITTPVTDINIKKVPKKKKERDCCEETRIFYMVETGKYLIRGYHKDPEYLSVRDWFDKKIWDSFDENNDEDCIQAYEQEHRGTGIADIGTRRHVKFNCDRFREQLGWLGLLSSDAAIKFWEECER